MTVTEQTPAFVPELPPTAERTASAHVEYWSPDRPQPRSIAIDLRFGKGVAARSVEELPIGKSLWVREADAVYGVFVADCVRTAAGFESKLEFLGGGRRGDDRVPVGDRAKTVWRVEGEAFRVTDVVISNVSQGGLQMRSPEKIAVGSLVSVTGDDFQCLGTVCYCTRGGDGFLAGIQFSKRPMLDSECAA